MTTTIHNLKREPMQSGDVRIDRTTQFGNPFLIGRDGSRDEVIAMFEARECDLIARSPRRRDAVRALHDKRLFCWCAPLPCHGDVLARLAAELTDAGSAPRGA